MNCLDIRGYPQPRFASEYGLQSLPQFKTLSSVTVKQDWSYYSPIMMHRQHHGSGTCLNFYLTLKVSIRPPARPTLVLCVTPNDYYILVKWRELPPMG